MPGPASFAIHEIHDLLDLISFSIALVSQLNPGLPGTL